VEISDGAIIKCNYELCVEVVNKCSPFIHSFIHQWLYSPLLGPGQFFSFVIVFTQSVGLLGRVISPSQGRYLHTGQHKHRINAHTDIHAFEWDSNVLSQRSSERRQLMPETAQPLWSANKSSIQSKTPWRVTLKSATMWWLCHYYSVFGVGDICVHEMYWLDLIEVGTWLELLHCKCVCERTAQLYQHAEISGFINTHPCCLPFNKHQFSPLIEARTRLNALFEYQCLAADMKINTLTFPCVFSVLCL
jgi:hypothetical protein